MTRLVGAQFPEWAQLPVERVDPGGWDNQTFRLGETMSVRLPSARWYAGQVEKEHRWLPTLAPLLPLPVPVPLAMGVPDAGYPWHWSVYRWLDGDPAAEAGIEDLDAFGTELADFLVALQQIDPVGGPAPGTHNFFRGGPLSVYDAETRTAIAALRGQIDTEAASAVWEVACNATWKARPVWVHGDVASGNLLVEEGRLSAVIDFGCSAVGDPACDLVIAWTFLSETSREAFRRALLADEETWARARGWALWKALITVARADPGESSQVGASRHVIDEVLSEHFGGT